MQNSATKVPSTHEAETALQRSIEAPHQEWLTDQEAAAWLSIPVSTLVRLAADGAIPGPKKWSNRERRWGWETVLAISILLKVGFLDDQQMGDDSDPLSSAKPKFEGGSKGGRRGVEGGSNPP